MISHHTNSFHESLKSHLLVSNFPQHDRIGRAGAKLPLLDRYAHAWMWAHGGWEVRPASTAVPRGHAGLRAPRDPMLPGLQPVRREPSRERSSSFTEPLRNVHKCGRRLPEPRPARLRASVLRQRSRVPPSVRSTVFRRFSGLPACSLTCSLIRSPLELWVNSLTRLKTDAMARSLRKGRHPDRWAALRNCLWPERSQGHATTFPLRAWFTQRGPRSRQSPSTGGDKPICQSGDPPSVGARGGSRWLAFYPPSGRQVDHPQ